MVLLGLVDVFPSFVLVNASGNSISSEAASLEELVDLLCALQQQDEARGFPASMLYVSLLAVPRTFAWSDVMELELLAALWGLCRNWEWDVVFLNVVPTGLSNQCQWVCCFEGSATVRLAGSVMVNAGVHRCANIVMRVRRRMVSFFVLHFSSLKMNG